MLARLAGVPLNSRHHTASSDSAWLIAGGGERGSCRASKCYTSSQNWYWCQLAVHVELGLERGAAVQPLSCRLRATKSCSSKVVQNCGKQPPSGRKVKREAHLKAGRAWRHACFVTCLKCPALQIVLGSCHRRHVSCRQQQRWSSTSRQALQLGEALKATGQAMGFKENGVLGIVTGARNAGDAAVPRRNARPHKWPKTVSWWRCQRVPCLRPGNSSSP